MDLPEARRLIMIFDIDSSAQQTEAVSSHFVTVEITASACVASGDSRQCRTRPPRALRDAIERARLSFGGVAVI